MEDRRQQRIREIVRIVSHADAFGIPNILIDMVYAILMDA